MGKVKVTFDDKQFLAGLSKSIAEIKVDSVKAVDRLGKNIVDSAQRKVPINTGYLRESIGILDRDLTPTHYRITVGTRVSYAGYVEYGTAPHVIRVRSAKVLTDGERFFGTQVNHPGTSPSPYLRPAIVEAVATWGVRT